MHWRGEYRSVQCALEVVDGRMIGVAGCIAQVNARGVEVLVRDATEGEAWVDNVQAALRSMLSEEARNSTAAPAESEVSNCA